MIHWLKKISWKKGLETALVLFAVSFSSNAVSDNIIVSGASGQLGGLAVQELLRRGVDPENLILVSRTPERLANYAQMGVSTRFGDFSQPESLTEAYRGGDRLLLISLNTRGNPNPDVTTRRVEFQKTAIDAAVDAGMEHIVYTSFVDAPNNSSPIAVDHRVTERDLQNSGIAWTILRNQWYAERLIGLSARILEAGEIVGDPAQVGTAYASREDCAAAAAAALLDSRHENQIYEITGTELIGPNEMASLLYQLTGREIPIVAPGSDNTPLTVPDLPSGATLTDDFQQLTGRPSTSIRQLLESNREDW